jgi:thioredoxin 1
MVNEVTAENFDAWVLKSELPVLVDFWAAWCAPCRMVAPIVDEIADAYQNTLRVGKLNVDDHPEIAKRYGVASIPCLIVYRGGEVVRTIVGARPRQVLLQELEPVL